MVVIVFDVIWFLHIKTAAEEVLELKKVVNQEMSQNSNITSLKKDINSLEESQQKIDRILIERDGVVSFIETLENVAETTNTILQIKDVDVEVIKEEEGEKEKELYGQLNMVFNVAGSWSGVTRYLSFVESLPYRVSIDSLRLSTATNEEEEVGWSMNMVITGITH